MRESGARSSRKTGRPWGRRSACSGAPWTTSSGSSRTAMRRRSRQTSSGSSARGSACRDAPRPRGEGPAVSCAGRRAPVITIDGPAGAGKSTVARELARRLGFRLVSTGALYRGLAWAVRMARIDPSDGDALQAVLDRTVVTLAGGRILVDGHDVTQEIRAPAI